MYKNESVAFLVITTSNKRDEWKSVRDTYLFNMTLRTFLLTHDKEYQYKFYIGIDKYDRIFDKKESQEEIMKTKRAFPNVEIEFITYDNNKIPKGHHTKMWTELFKKAYEDGYDYFYQCGDDIRFKTKGWIKDSIKTLQSHNDIGLTGPINNNPRILTQSFVSRKHMDIFGYYMPEEIINWCCDDWYNWVYQPNYFYPLNNHFASNDGGAPRYAINDDKEFTEHDKFNTKLKELRENTMKIAMRDREKIVAYLNK